MIRAVIFDLDNTLTDFMKMKRASIDAAVDGMLDAGLPLSREEVSRKIYLVYDREGIEYQQVFDRFLQEELGRVDYKVLTSAVVAYRRARDSYLVLYPHVNFTLLELIEDRHAEVRGKALHAVVGVADPLSSQLDWHPRYRLGGQDAPADPVAGLEEDGLPTRCEDLARGYEPRQPGADDDHVLDHPGGDASTRVGAIG